MELITLQNAKKVKEILLNNYIEDDVIELEYKHLNAKIKIDSVSETEDSPVFTDRDMKFAMFMNDIDPLEDRGLCVEINNKKHMLYMNIGDWGYEYRMPNMHFVLGTTYNFGSSKEFFSQLEISQALEDEDYIYIVKNLSKLSGEGAISRINNGLKADKEKKHERRRKLVERLSSECIFYDNNKWVVVYKIQKAQLNNEDNYNNIFFHLIRAIINYSFTIEEIIAEDKKA